MALSRDFYRLKIDAPKLPKLESSRTGVGWPEHLGLAVFVLCLLLPAYHEFAGLRLSPLRLFLIATFVPFSISVITGRVGAFNITDGLILAYCIWVFVALSVVHGSEHLPFAGISVIEALGGYMAGRFLIRGSKAYKKLIVYMAISLAVLFPPTLIEAFTGIMMIPDLIEQAVMSNNRDPSAYGRLGLERVYSVFEHPILFGLYCVAGLCSFHYLFSERLGYATVALALAMTFFSLSSAPLLAAAVQVLLILWARVTGGKWGILICFTLFLYIAVDLLSDRTPVTILIEKLTFNPLSGWTRIAIFDAGMAAVWAHPLFGIGFNDWPRPAWLTSSVDNFWLLNAMRYGMVGGGILILAFVAQAVRTMRATCQTPEDRQTRRAYMITLAAICFTLCTVHVWGSLGVFVMFFLGASGWMTRALPQRKDPLDQRRGYPTSRSIST